MKKSSKKVAPATPAGAAGVGGNVRPAAPTSSTDRDNTSLETLTEDMIHDLEMAFRLFDEDGSGSISINELEHVFESMGQKPTKEEVRTFSCLLTVVRCSHPRSTRCRFLR